MDTNFEINFEDLVIAHKFAPEAAVTYTKTASNNSVKLRFSKDFIEKYLEGKLNVEVGYSQKFNMITINNVDEGGRTITLNKNGHGAIEFSRMAFPVHAKKVCLDDFKRYEGRWYCFFPSEND